MTYPSLTDRGDHYDLEKCSEQGLLLPDVSADALEEILILNEFDLMSRARLMGYYSKSGNPSHRTRFSENKLKHIIWFINNAPDCKFAGDIYFQFDRKKHPELYSKIKSAWTQQIDAKPASLQIKINASLFSLHSEPGWSLRIARSALRQDAKNLWIGRILQTLEKPNKKSSIVPTLVSTSNIDLEKWRKLADRSYLETHVFNGERMPPLSAKTLETVLAKYPDDLSARAELLGFYYANSIRANHFGVDPDCIHALVKHLLWCIAYIPGSKFVGRFWGIKCIDKKTLPEEYSRICDAWTQTLNSHSDNTAVLASAGAFFSRFGQPERSKQLLNRVTKNEHNDEGVHYILKYGVTRRTRSERDATTKPKSAILNEIALAIDTKVKYGKSPFRKQFSLAEWSSEIPLGRAQLAGSYHWVPAKSIANLEDVMTRNSMDMYNRAKIIGSYGKYYGRGYFDHELTDAQHASHLRHVSWFINHVSACQLLGQFKYVLSSFKKYRPDSFNAVQSSLLKALERNKKDPRVFVNVITAFSEANKTEARRLYKLLLKAHPAFRRQTQRILGIEIVEPSVQDKLRSYEFVPAMRVRRLTRAAKQLDLVHQMISLGRNLSLRTLWSNEQVLKRNPRDLLLRAELLDGYDSSEEFQLYFNGYSPDCEKQLVKHNLWFIQNIPDYYLYSGGCSVTNDGGFGRTLGEHAVLMEAAKQQIKQYPEDLQVGLALSHYFPLDYYSDSLKVLKQLQKLFPNNKDLKQRLTHVQEMVDRDKTRASWMKKNEKTLRKEFGARRKTARKSR